MAPNIVKVLYFLRKESNNPNIKRYTFEWLQNAEVYTQLRLLKILLCERDPALPLPSGINEEINKILKVQLNNKILTSTKTIPIKCSVNGVNISIWKGDITTLTDITAILNAANSKLLGCFQVGHRCIDNIIHSVAGPDLRRECYDITSQQNEEAKPGDTIVTPGFNLPSQYVIHAVGPQLIPGAKHTEKQRKQLSDCYESSLNALESLPALEDGRKVIAFCCISTGLFAFPGEEACKIAIRTVVEYLENNSNTSVTDVIFNVFTENDLNYYVNEFENLKSLSPNYRAITSQNPTPITFASINNNIQTAKDWIASADYLIISAGAGLSSSVGLDYNSRELFADHYSNFTKYGLRTLYESIGFSWPTPLVMWSFYLHHLSNLMSWPQSSTYQDLLKLTKRFGDKYFVITTNADNFFYKNGFSFEKIFTPQGSYRYIQCVNNCRPDSYFEFPEYLNSVKHLIDPRTNLLSDESQIPKCPNCGGTMTLCVRGGSYFNESPFQTQKHRYREFLNNIEDGSKVVILELGVGLNTPSILRWSNEEQVMSNNYKLIRAGLGPSGCVPFEVLDTGNTVVIEGDIKDVNGYILDR